MLPLPVPFSRHLSSTNLVFSETRKMHALKTVQKIGFSGKLQTFNIFLQRN